jgi:polyribonucleotide nucleotidyltransferase
VRPSAPKIISFEIPIDKIGEVIGPKGKVINTIQQETGADISVDDDGMVGTVTLGSPDKGAIDEAERQIKLILNPPTADVGAVYPGRVVNITKFGAFVNILPGRDGLLHISKIGGGKRIDKVEDVFSLGDEVEVKVDDVDPNGKVSLSLASAVEIPDSAVSSGGGGRDRERAPRTDDAPVASGGTEVVSFEDTFDAEVAQEFGDLGPAATEGGGRGGERRGGDRGRRSSGGRGGRR